MKTTYSLAQHVPSGDLYAVLSRDELPCATCGPLHYSDVQHYGDLEMLDYSTEDIESGWWDEQDWTAATATTPPRQ